MKLEVGKCYRTRSGSIVTIVEYKEADGYPFKSDTGHSYLPNGREYSSIRHSNYDLIKEVKMLEITKGKQYRTRDGRPVNIVAVTSGITYAVVGIIKDTASYSTWDLYGKSWHSEYVTNDTDLVEVQPYDDFKIDDKVLVKDYDDHTWSKRHFAGVNDAGKATAFRNGESSYTTKGVITSWSQCVKWEDRTESMGIDNE